MIQEERKKYSIDKPDSEIKNMSKNKYKDFVRKLINMLTQA